MGSLDQLFWENWFWHHGRNTKTMHQLFQRQLCFPRYESQKGRGKTIFACWSQVQNQHLRPEVSITSMQFKWHSFRCFRVCFGVFLFIYFLSFLTSPSLPETQSNIMCSPVTEQTTNTTVSKLLLFWDKIIANSRFGQPAQHFVHSQQCGFGSKT